MNIDRSVPASRQYKLVSILLYGSDTCDKTNRMTLICTFKIH